MTAIRTFVPVVLVGALALLVAPAWAGTFYLGAGAGESSTDDLSVADLDDGSFVDGSLDDSDTAIKAFVGYRFLKFVAIEVGYVDLGEFTIEGTSDGSGPDFFAGPVDAAAEVDGYDVSVLGILPIGKRLKVFARAGYYLWDSEVTVSNGGLSLSEDDDGEDTLIGAGASFRLGAGIDVRAEYEQFDVDDITVDVISAGLTWRF
jgi:OOP family OmpA-OmpF porin